jgi:hypothetical protein
MRHNRSYLRKKATMPSITLKFTTTGEFRHATKGEWYLEDGWPVLRTYDGTGCYKFKILRLISQKRKGVPLELDKRQTYQSNYPVTTEKEYFQVPVASFEFTGEFRLPKNGEWFITGENEPAQQADGDYKKNSHRIMRRLTKTEAKELVFTRRNDNNGARKVA